MKKLSALVVAIVMVLSVVGCSEASKVNYNMTQDAKAFKLVRKVTAYNARTDKVIFIAEGLINIETDSENNELVITAKVGEDSYKKNYVYLNDYVIYTVEDTSDEGHTTDPYHYQFYFYGDVVSNVSVKSYSDIHDEDESNSISSNESNVESEMEDNANGN